MPNIGNFFVFDECWIFLVFINILELFSEIQLCHLEIIFLFLLRFAFMLFWVEHPEQPLGQSLLFPSAEDSAWFPMWTRFFHSGWWECQLSPALCDSAVILPAPSWWSFPFPWVLLLDVLIQTLVMTRGTMSPGFLLLSPWTCLFSHPLLYIFHLTWLLLTVNSTFSTQGFFWAPPGLPLATLLWHENCLQGLCWAVVRIILFSFCLSKITTLLLPSFLKCFFSPTHFV